MITLSNFKSSHKGYQMFKHINTTGCQDGLSKIFSLRSIWYNLKPLNNVTHFLSQGVNLVSLLQKEVSIIHQKYTVKFSFFKSFQFQTISRRMLENRTC